MSHLPSGWKLLPLAEVAEVCLGKMLDKKRTSGVPMPYLRNINVRWGHIDRSDLLTMPFQAHELERFGLRHGDVLVCEGGEPGRAAVWTGDAKDLKFQKALHRVRLNGEVDPRWLVQQLFLDAHRGALSEHLTGTTIRHFTGESIKAYQVVVPPLDTQRAIVAAIEAHFSRLDAATATLERVQRNLERYRASVLKAAVEGRLVPTEAELAKKEGRSYEPASVLLRRVLAERRRRWEEAELAKLKAKGKPPTDDRWKSRYEEPAAPDTDGLPELPEGWCWASVDQLATEVCYGTSAKTGDDDAGVPVIRMGNIVNGALDLSELKFLPSNHDEFPSLLLEPGDLLFNRTNSAELVGKTAVYSGIPSPCSFASYLIRVRVAGGCRAEFLSAFINSAAGRRWIASVVTQQVGQANVNGSKLRACVLPLPPTSEQVRIVDAVDAAATVTRHLAGDVAAVRVRVARLRQSILKWAFEGRLVESSASMQVQRAAGSA
ncbi:MAG: restriction endonuclease subunit S [Planctomycetes bacterium]|nr:restriction endonuclease subunit S [Planctomycetota bacterium]